LAEFINEKFNNDEEFIKDLSMSSNKKHSFILKSEIETFNIKGNRIKANEGCCWFKIIIFCKIIYFIFYNNFNI